MICSQVGALTTVNDFIGRAARGLADGAPCRAFNDRGECFLTLAVSDDVPVGVAVAESIWWSKRHPHGKGVNQLTSAELTDLGRCARFHDGLVQVEAAPAQAQPTASDGSR